MKDLSITGRSLEVVEECWSTSLDQRNCEATEGHSYWMRALHWVLASPSNNTNNIINDNHPFLHCIPDSVLNVFFLFSFQVFGVC